MMVPVRAMSGGVPAAVPTGAEDQQQQQQPVVTRILNSQSPTFPSHYKIS